MQLKPNLTVLNSGLHVLTIDTKTFPTITTALLVGAGSRYEDVKNNGIAHFFEHMTFKGSKNYPNTGTIASAIEGIGGLFNAFTSKDHTGYWVKTTTKHLETTIKVLSDMVLNPILDSQEIEREKGVIIEEINMYEDNPQDKVQLIYDELVYPNSQLGMTIAGPKDNIANFNRQTFLDYMEQLYKPNNALFVVAGGLGSITSQNIADIISKYTDNWKSGKVKGFDEFKENQLEPQIKILTRNTEQAHLCLGFRGISFKDKRQTAFSVMSIIMGGAMSSRLFLQVRERRGLCYYIRTYQDNYADTGTFVTSAGVTNKFDKLQEAINTINNEYRKLKINGVATEELTRAKEIMKGRILLSLEDSRSVALTYATKRLLEKSNFDIQTKLEEIDAVTQKDIIDIAREFLTAKKANLAIIGPFEKVEIDDFDWEL